MFGRILERYAKAVVRYRIAVLAFMLIATGMMVAQLGSLKLDNDPDIWAPQNSEITKTTLELDEIFGGRNFVVVGIVPKHGDIYRPDILEKVRRIQAGIEALPEAIKSNTLSLAARRAKAISGSDEQMVVTRMLETIPQTPAELEKLKSAIGSNPIYIDALVSPDGSAAAIVADFRLPKDDPRYAPLYLKIRDIVDKERDQSVDIHLAGQPVLAAGFEFAMEKMPLYFGMAFLIIMSVQLAAFRSTQGMLLPMVTAILSVLWGLGLMSLLGIHLDAINTTTPILIMAVAAGHAIQILKRYYEELGRLAEGVPGKIPHSINHEAVIISLSRVGPVMVTAGSIASIAFLSLTASDVTMIRHFGIFAGLGIFSAVLIEMSFIPALRAILPAGSGARLRTEPGRLDRNLAAIGRNLASPRVSMAVLAGMLVIVSAAVMGTLRLHVDNSVKQYSKPESQVRQDDFVLNEKFGGTDAIMFLVDGGAVDSIKDPRVLDAMDRLQEYISQQPHVGKTQSMADLIKRMNQAVHSDDSAFDAIPGTRELIGQYLLLYSLSGDPQDFDSFVDYDYRKAAIWVYLKTDSTEYAQALYEKAKQFIAREFPSGVEVRVGGGLMQTVAINASITNTKIMNIMQMAVVVLLLSSLAFRSVVAGLLVTIPLGVIVFANLGLMGWMGMPLNMGTATVAAMVTGIGADYEIYMLYRLKEEFSRRRDLAAAMEAVMPTSGKAVLIVASAIAGGYSSLLLSDFGFYTSLATTMTTTMLVSALLALVFLRAIVAVFKPSFVVGHAGAAATGIVIPAVVEDK